MSAIKQKMKTRNEMIFSKKAGQCVVYGVRYKNKISFFLKMNVCLCCGCLPWQRSL